jgi:hypothetical protein
MVGARASVGEAESYLGGLRARQGRPVLSIATATSATAIPRAMMVYRSNGLSMAPCRSARRRENSQCIGRTVAPPRGPQREAAGGGKAALRGRLAIVHLSPHGMLCGSVADGSGSGNARRACCPAPKSGDREEEGGLNSLT